MTAVTDKRPTTETAQFVTVPSTPPPRVLDPKWDGRSTFSVPEAAQILGISRGAGYAAAKAGQIPVVWIGSRAVVPRHALEKLLLG